MSEQAILTFAVSTCAYRQKRPFRFGEVGLEIAHRASLVHVLDRAEAEKFARWLLKTNHPIADGWTHVGYTIASPEDTMQFPDVTGQSQN